MTELRITWRVMAASICGIVAGTLLAMAVGQAVLFDAPALGIGTGVGGLMAAGGGLLIANSGRSPRHFR